MMARDETTVTDVPAYWLFPSAAKFDTPFKRLRDMDFQSAAKKRMVDNTKPCHSREVEAQPQSVPSPTKEEELTFFKELHRALPKSAILSLTDMFSEEFTPKAVNEKMPLEIAEFFKSLNIDGIEYEDIVKRCQKIEVNLTDNHIKFVESQTRKQSESAVWFKQRRGRITSSLFHAVCHTSIEHPSISLLNKITRTSSSKLMCAAIDWGKRKENVARDIYVKIMKDKHSKFILRESGLQLIQEHYQFAASPDGMTECSCCGFGCVEIKCPYSMREKKDLDLNWFCGDGESKRLSNKHSHYYQIQMQLFVTKQDHCDFFVWWPNGFYLERIVSDQDFLNENVKKALEFHKMCVLPELVSNYFSSKRTLSESTHVKSNNRNQLDNSQTYCICNGGDDGSKMIMCESENCDKLWYHMKCINLKKVPKGKWICLSCR